MNAVTVGENAVSIKSYKGNRVVTFKDIDTVHGRTEGTASRNFRRNREHFVEGEDFFKISSDEFRRTIGSMDIRQQNSITVLTESGYLMLAKSFTDDKAWDVQRTLVKSYFRAKSEEPKYEQMKLEEKPYEYFDKFFGGQPVLTVTDLEHLTGVSGGTITYVLRKFCTENTDYIDLMGSELCVFKKENPKVCRNINRAIIVFKSGFDVIEKRYGFTSKAPKNMIEEKKNKAKETNYNPQIDDCITALNVLKYVREVAEQSANANKETVKAIGTAINFTAIALSVKTSIEYCK